MTSPAEILRKPYARIVIPEEDGTYFAQIKEFPGCIATGESQIEALTNLDGVALDWIDAAIAQGLSIPEPLTESDYSGKILVRLPKSLHAKAAQVAEADAVSLNSLILTAVAVYVGASETKAAIRSADQNVHNYNVVFGSPTMVQLGAINVSAAGWQSNLGRHEPQITLYGGSWNKLT